MGQIHTVQLSSETNVTESSSIICFVTPFPLVLSSILTREYAKRDERVIVDSDNSFYSNAFTFQKQNPRIS